MVYRIRKTFEFSASHALVGLPPEHQCSRLHGHNYVVTLELAADELAPPGFVVDYGALGAFKALVGTLDHQHLNEIVAFNPTAENLASWLFTVAKLHWPQVSAVAVQETPKTWAEYRL